MPPSTRANDARTSTSVVQDAPGRKTSAGRGPTLPGQKHIALVADETAKAIQRGFSLTKKHFNRQFRKLRIRQSKTGSMRVRRLWTKVHRGNRLGVDDDADMLTNHLGVCLQFAFTAMQGEREAFESGAYDGVWPEMGGVTREVYSASGLRLANDEALPDFAYVVEAPKEFAELRRAWGMDAASYGESFRLEGLNAKFDAVSVVGNIKQGKVTTEGGRLGTSSTTLRVISQALASGKSKSWFFCSEDGTLLVKTCDEKEKKTLLRILPDYLDYVRENGTTSMLPQIYGLYTIKFAASKRPLSFIVMNYWFASSKSITRRFDLKGSTCGRHASERELAKGSACIYKDNDFDDKDAVRTKHNTAILDALRKDTEFLSGLNLIDYSLVYGEYEASTPKELLEAQSAFEEFEGTDNWVIRQRAAAVTMAATADREMEEKMSVGNSKDHSDEESIGHQSDTSEEILILEKASMFTPFIHDVARLNQLRTVNRPAGAVFIGVIDILTTWNPRKKVEWFFSSFLYCGKDVSCQRPKFYANRFNSFMENSVFLPPEQGMASPRPSNDSEASQGRTVRE